PTQKGKRVKRPAKKATTVPTTGVIIKDTPDKSVSKNKSPAKIGRGKGIELLSDAALLEEAQLRETQRKSKQKTHKLQASGLNEEYVYTQEKDKSVDEEKMFEEEDDDVVKELYEDLNITQGLRDTDMTNAEKGGEDQENASYVSGFVQEKEDAHVTLTSIHDKTE
nr:hypothetical protein [Tanacetum cinerariifolium]